MPTKRAALLLTGVATGLCAGEVGRIGLGVFRDRYGASEEGVEARVVYEWYPVAGPDVEAVSEQLDVLLREQFGLGENVWGLTYGSMDSDTTWVPIEGSAGQCQVHQVKVTADVLVIVPVWTDIHRADSNERDQWRVLLAELIAHEREHVDITVDHAMTLWSQLRLLAERPCDTADSAERDTMDRVEAARLQAQDSLDQDDRRWTAPARGPIIQYRDGAKSEQPE